MFSPDTAPQDSTYSQMDMLRFSTAGSVDDGKSTLIGRLLYDTKSIFEDQMEAIEAASSRRGEEYVDLALLTDGLRAEREQRITIDVAYRYFATPKRKFIIADTPGHIQYTRNMVTGASTAELAIILVDARNGVLTQSKRHAFISSLLQIPHIVVAINKMDLVDYSEEVYERIARDFREFAEKLDVDDVTYIPISALKGDNIVHKSENMPWYDGPTLLHHLEHVNVGTRQNNVDFRFPVQYVIRPNWEYRGFAGRIASGRVRRDDEVVILPSRKVSTVKSIDTPDGISAESASAGESVVITLKDEIDVSRGDMIVRKNNLPNVGNVFEASLCWMHEIPAEINKPYVLMHTSKSMNAYLSAIEYRIDVDTLERESVGKLGLNEIGRVEIIASQPLAFDPYRSNDVTGSFILIDPGANVTVGAGMIRSAGSSLVDSQKDDTRNSVVSAITRQERESRNDHHACVIDLSGIDPSVAVGLERRLFDAGNQTILLDRDYGVTRLLFENGNMTLCLYPVPTGQIPEDFLIRASEVIDPENPVDSLYGEVLHQQFFG